MRLTDWQLAVESYLLGEQLQPDSSLQASLLGSPTLSVEQGLQIYHNAYRARLLAALREDFPALHYWLGDEQFDQLGSAFLKACPSAHYSLRWLGARFPDFIAQHGVIRQRAPLAELARLEWSFTLAFDAADAEPLSLAQMASLPASDWPELHVQLLPCVQHLQLAYNSLALWQAAKAQHAFPPSEALPQAMDCLIWRHKLVSHYRSLSADEATALFGMCIEGWSFAQLCEALSAHAADASVRAAGWLKQWIVAGLLRMPAGRFD